MSTSKILESEVNEELVRHVFTENNLISERQWAYRHGHSTQLLLIHIIEHWRKVVEPGMVVAVAFIDFKKYLTAYLVIFLKQSWKRILA